MLKIKEKREQKRRDEAIIKALNEGPKKSPITGLPQEEPLKEEHPLANLLFLRRFPIKAVGTGAAKAIEFVGEKAMPSSFLKGVGTYLPWFAKTAETVSPYVDAAALSYWSTKAAQAAKESYQKGNIPQAVAEGTMAMLPMMPIALNPNAAKPLTSTTKVLEQPIVEEVKSITQPAINKTVSPEGKIRLSLPSHTSEMPREIVLEPQGGNKFYVHVRTWNGDHVPANLSVEDKQTLYNALYNELPEGAEILFPQSSSDYLATRGTVAGLRRLARDPRFTPGSSGTLQYVDKDGTIKTFNGTSFIKGDDVLKSITYTEAPKDLSTIRQGWSKKVIPANRRFYLKPDLEYAGIPKAERNNKFRTMKFRVTQAEKDAQELWRQKRNLYERWKAVGKKRGLKFNEYDEPEVPISADPSIVQQSNLVKQFKKQFGVGIVPESELPFDPIKEQQGWIDYFKSPAYRARVIKNSGLKTDQEIDEFINSLINNMKSVSHHYESMPQIVEKNVMVYNDKTGEFTVTPVLVQGSEGGHYSPANHFVLVRNARGKRAKEVFTHEDLHASLKPNTNARKVLEDSGLIDAKLVDKDGEPLIGDLIKVGDKYFYSNGLEEIEPISYDTSRHNFNAYVAGRDESRVRGLKILRALDEEGLPVTEDNVTTKIWNMEDNDVSQLGRFTPKSRTDYLDRLFVLPLIGLGGAALSKQKQGGTIK